MCMKQRLTSSHMPKGRRERNALRRSLYKIIRKKLKSDGSRTSQRDREKRSLYKIVRNKSRRPSNQNKKPAVPRPDTETGEKTEDKSEEETEEETVKGNERRKKGMNPEEQEATSKEDVARKVGEEKRDCLTDPTEQGAPWQDRDIPSGKSISVNSASSGKSISVNSASSIAMFSVLANPDKETCGMWIFK